jgi:hypothetical protein
MAILINVAKIYRLQRKIKNRSEICLLTTVNMMITVYWVMHIVCFSLRGLHFCTEEDGVSSFEVMLECCQVTICRISKDSNLRRDRRTGKR